MKRFLYCLLIVVLFSQCSIVVLAEGSQLESKSLIDDVADWFTDITDDASDWATDAVGDVGDWVTDAADDVGTWFSDAANNAWQWTTDTASLAWEWTADSVNQAWNGIDGFFNPPSTEGTPNIVPEPELPAGTQKMYLGYEVQRTGLDNGYSGSKIISRNDPHFGLTLGKFYVSGFTSALSGNGEDFVFLKTVGDNVELHFELVQDIDMLGGDTTVMVNSDNGGYDKHFGVPPTYFGKGTLIVRHTDYQNNPGEPQVYADYLSAKMTGTADTVISLNEEGDYEVALDYEIKKDNRVLGTAAKTTSYYDYQLLFRFSVRNGNCMVFPFDVATGEELKNTAITENGFRLDMAYSRYLDINVKLSVLTESASGVVEDVRFNRPASDGEEYTQEGIYTFTVSNRYTGETTQKQIYVGSDPKLIDYIEKGYSVEKMIEEQEKN